jgi:hypothetical protein
MPVVAREVHETRLCDHFHAAGEFSVLKISIPDKETKYDGVRIWFQRENELPSMGTILSRV